MVRYRCIALQKLVSSNGPVQTRFAHIDVAFLGKSREQGEEGVRVHVIVIVHVTKPPDENRKKICSQNTRLVFYLTVWVPLHSLCSCLLPGTSQIWTLIFPFIGFILAQNESKVKTPKDLKIGWAAPDDAARQHEQFSVLKSEKFVVHVAPEESVFVSVHPFCFTELPSAHREELKPPTGNNLWSNVPQLGAESRF